MGGKKDKPEAWNQQRNKDEKNVSKKKRKKTVEHWKKNKLLMFTFLRSPIYSGLGLPSFCFFLYAATTKQKSKGKFKKKATRSWTVLFSVWNLTYSVSKKNFVFECFYEVAKTKNNSLALLCSCIFFGWNCPLFLAINKPEPRKFFFYIQLEESKAERRVGTLWQPDKKVFCIFCRSDSFGLTFGSWICDEIYDWNWEDVWGI